MNLGQLRTAIQDHGYGTDTVSQQNDFINMTYREIHSKERWPFLETINQAQATTQGTPNYTPPMTNWRNIDAVRIDLPSSGGYYDIKYADPQRFMDKLHRDPLTTATPELWTFYAQQVWFYPTPDNAYRISYYYIQEPVDLAADGDVPLIPIAFHDAIVAGAIQRMCVRQRDYINQELWTQKYETLVKRLEEEYKLTQRQTSSEVLRSGWWSTRVPFPMTSTGF